MRGITNWLQTHFHFINSPLKPHTDQAETADALCLVKGIALASFTLSHVNLNLEEFVDHTRLNAMPCTTTQVFFASFSPTQLSFSRPTQHCLNRKCTCAQLFAHGSENRLQIRLLSRDTFSLGSCQFHHLRSTTGFYREWETLISLLKLTLKTHQWLIKKIGITLLDHVPGAPTISHILSCASDYAWLRFFK